MAASCASFWSESFVAAPSFVDTATSVGGSVNDWRIATSVAGLPAIASEEKLEFAVTACCVPFATSKRYTRCVAASSIGAYRLFESGAQAMPLIERSQSAARRRCAPPLRSRSISCFVSP